MAGVCTDGKLNPVPFLEAGYTPKEPFDQSPKEGPGPINEAIRQDIQTDLTAAFDSAPPSFRAQLCELKGIYVNPTGCTDRDPRTCSLEDDQIANNSWGFRQNSTGERRAYIAISLGLWKNDPSNPWTCTTPHNVVCAPPFQKYQTRLIGALLQTLSRKAKNDDARPSFSTVKPPAADTAAMSVLATLAHEFGHVYWLDTFVPDRGGPFRNSTEFCKHTGLFYQPGSWSYPIDLPPGRWLGFGEILNRSNQADDSDVFQLPGLLAHGHFRDAGNHLNNIYRNGRWASALAAFSPIEEFVETFELFVLTNAKDGLQSLKIRIKGTRYYDDDILDNLNQATRLGTSYQCFGDIPSSLLRSRRPR